MIKLMWKFPMQVMLKDANGALEDFKAAIKLSPYSAHMYLNRGNLYASTQQYERAEKDYTKGKVLLSQAVHSNINLNIVNIGTPEIMAVIFLKFDQYGLNIQTV